MTFPLEKRTNHCHTTNPRRYKLQDEWIIFYLSPSIHPTRQGVYLTTLNSKDACLSSLICTDELIKICCSSKFQHRVYPNKLPITFNDKAAYLEFEWEAKGMHSTSIIFRQYLYTGTSHKVTTCPD